jgi:hypothetical protein
MFSQHICYNGISDAEAEAAQLSDLQGADRADY